MRQVIGIILFSLFLFFPAPLFAQEATDAATTRSSSPTAIPPTPSPIPQINYNLAYPGILPDNPLYFLKAIRDRIIEFLINDALKKAEFSLLTSDKRFYASYLLVEKNKGELSVSTLSKSNNYFEKALSLAGEAKNAGKNVDTVLSNLNPALEKRKEFLPTLSESMDESLVGRLDIELKRLEGFESRVNELTGK